MGKIQLFAHFWEITFSNQSFLVLFSFCASLVRSLIMSWLAYGFPHIAKLIILIIFYILYYV